MTPSTTSNSGRSSTSRASQNRFVGTNPGVVAMWQATPHLTLTGVITRFLPGGYVQQSFVAHGFGFYSSSITYRF